MAVANGPAGPNWYVIFFIFIDVWIYLQFSIQISEYGWLFDLDPPRIHPHKSTFPPRGFFLKNTHMVKNALQMHHVVLFLKQNPRVLFDTWIFLNPTW